MKGQSLMNKDMEAEYAKRTEGDMASAGMVGTEAIGAELGGLSVPSAPCGSKSRVKKRRVMIALVAVAVLLLVSISAVYATGNGAADGTDAADAEVMIQGDENGNTRFSLDGGKTWKEGMPDEMPPGAMGGGAVFSTEGGVTLWSLDASDAPPEASTGGKNVAVSEPLPEGETEQGLENSLSVRMENGVTEYSVDGGQTWSQTPPVHVVVSEGGDGSVRVETNGS
jgi:hypothetical protein